MGFAAGACAFLAMSILAASGCTSSDPEVDTSDGSDSTSADVAIRSPAQQGSTSLPSDGPAADVSGRMNVVLITADDMRADDLKAMPFTRSLTKRGVRFTDGISPYPLCCPARGEIITGQHSHNSGVRGNRFPNGGYWSLQRQNGGNGHDNTLPVWLQEAGYRTAFVGKYMNEYATSKKRCDVGAFRDAQPELCAFLDERDDSEVRAVPPGWNRWYASLDRAYKYTGGKLRVGKDGETETRQLDRDDYHTRYFSDDVIQDEILASFLDDDDENRDDPFFIWFSSATPHTRNVNQMRTVCKIDGSEVVKRWVPPIPETDEHLERFADQPLPRHRAFRDAFNTEIEAGPMKGRDRVCRGYMRRLHRHRLASLVSLDNAVKRIVEELKAKGERRNTVLIFTSDNGYSLGEHRFEGKDVPYDDALRVPVVVSAPGLKRAYRDEQSANKAGVSPFTVTTLDLPATIVSIADATPGRPLEGIDMMDPTANPDHPSQGGDRAVLIESGSSGPTLDNCKKFAGVRTNRWSWWGWDLGPASGDCRDEMSNVTFDARDRYEKTNTTFIEFYDRHHDPSQVNNLRERRWFPDVDRRLRKMTRNRADCKGQECVWSYSAPPAKD